MRTARVYNDTGKIAAWGKNPKPVQGTTEIKEPVPSDYHPTKRPYLWGFVSEVWSLDQRSIKKRSNKKDRREKKVEDKEKAYSDTQSLLDDPSTRWNDPTGEILKSVVQHINNLTINTR